MSLTSVIPRRSLFAVLLRRELPGSCGDVRAFPVRDEAAAMVECHVVSDRYQVWPPGPEIVPAEIRLGLAMSTETAATCTHLVQFGLQLGHCGSSISWCEFHPPQRCHRGADHVAVRCPLATAIARSAVGCCDCAAVTAMTSLPRTRTSVEFELITAITAVRSTIRSGGVQFPNALRGCRYIHGSKSQRSGCWPIPVRKVHRGASQTGLGGARRAHSFRNTGPLLAAQPVCAYRSRRRFHGKMAGVNKPPATRRSR
jgi:hypothetical protein